MPKSEKSITFSKQMCYNESMTRGACPPWPDSPDLLRIGVRTKGGGRMRFSEFLKYLIVLILVMTMFVAITR